MITDINRFQKKSKAMFQTSSIFFLFSLISLGVKFIFNTSLQDFYIAELLYEDIQEFIYYSFMIGVISFWIGQQYSKYYTLLKTASKTLSDKQIFMLFDEIYQNPWIRKVATGVFISIIFLYALIINLHPILVESSSLFDFIKSVGQEYGYLIPITYIIISFYGFFQLSTGLKKRRALIEKINSILNHNLQQNT